MKSTKVLSFLYLLSIVFLFLYSYTQVDLSLTLSRISIWQAIQKSFQYIGYFQRPLSTELFTALIIVLFIFYFIFLFFAKKGKINNSQIWIVIIIQTIILTFSYNAFSYDLFNYIFDAKIVTHYHLNPYLHSALDFPSDPMLHFMHWVQRRLPYGPVWLAITIPFSLLGFQYFLPTFFLFKILMSGFYLISVYFIGKIVKIISPKDYLNRIILFALNPLIVIESLVSSHNEIVSVGISLIAVYFILRQKNIRSIIIFIISILIKFTSFFLFPLFFFALFFRKNKFSWQLLFEICIPFMIMAVILETIRTNFQPWYLVSVLPLASLGHKKIYTVVPAIVFSIISLLQYVPFLYLGNWDPPVPTILNFMLLAAAVISVLIILLFRVKKVLQFK